MLSSSFIKIVRLRSNLDRAETITCLMYIVSYVFIDIILTAIKLIKGH